MPPPTLSPELRAAHRAISPQDLEFRQAAKDDPRLQIPPTAEFVRERGIAVGYTDTIRGLFVHVVGEARSAGLAADGELNVAIVREPGVAMGSAVFQAYLREEYARTRAALGGLAGEVRECYPEELLSAEGEIRLAGRRIEAVVEFNDTTPRDV